MILVDFNGVAMGTINSMNLPPDEGLLRHTILNTLRSIYTKHKAKYGEMVLCCDSSSWRRDYYEFYKYKRRADRDSSDKEQAYWSKVFDIIGTVRSEIRDFLPWKVIHVSGAEGDDIIAALTQRTQEFGMHEDVMIIAADSDYKQLQIFDNVKQYSPQQKKMVVEKQPHKWLFEAIVKGQGGKDGVPNIRTHDSFFKDKIEGNASRQKVISAKQLDTWWEARNDLENAMSADEYRNFIRNRTLIDFNHIPEDLIERIFAQYDEYETPPFGGVLKYFISRKLKNLIDNINDFK